MKPDDYFIDKPTYGVYGLSRKYENEKNVLVEYGIPGDVVKIKKKHEDRNAIFAYIDKFVKRSPLRQKEPFCPVYGKCGGCTYGDLKGETEGRLKKEVLKDLIEREGVKANINEFVPSPKYEKYRIRTRMKLDHRGLLGYSQLRSNRIISVNNCPICSDEINRIIRRFNKAMKTRGSISKHLREIEIVEGDDGVGIHFITDRLTEFLENRIKKICLKLGVASHVVTQLDKGEFYVRGRKLKMTLGKEEYKFYPASFMQANKEIASNMLQSIRGYVEINDISGDMIDLYSGIGTFAKYLEDRFSRIYLVENSPYSNQDSKGTFAGSFKVSYYEKEVRSALDYIKKLKIKPGLIILDPPRKHPPEYVFRKIRAFDADHIIYISCNPPALLHDMKLFYKKYYLDSLIGFDMFPHTYHTEIVAFMRRKNK